MNQLHILYNARIHTLNPAQTRVSALAILDGRILAAGTDAALRAEFAGRGVHEDLAGQTVLPGLVDAHLHLEHYALGLRKVDCETPTKAECLRRVRERAQTTPAGQWILGHGWNQNNWDDGFGNASDLDAVAPNHPVYLTAKSLHAAWANSAALRLAGLNAHTPDPEGGKLGRTEKGELTGILFERAMQLVDQVIPEPSETEVEQAIEQAQQTLFRFGLTGIHDFDRRRCFAALQNLHRDGRLHLRVIKSLPMELLDYAVGIGLSTGFGDDWLRIGSIKAFADGALGPQTAAMLQPYEGSSENRGILLLDSEELYEKGRAAVKSGLSLAVHAIGDLANHEVLDAFSQLREYEKTLDFLKGKRLRHRIEHVQVLHADDAARLAGLGVIASMQPIHATSDMQMADRYWGKRAALSYALRTQLNYGAALAFGSDAPVESPNPWWGLHAAVTRRRPDGTPGEQGWYPEQRLNLLEALNGFTTGAAYAAGTEDRQGQLSPGYFADLIVMEQDPFECPPEELHQLLPQATMTGGQWVWKK